MINENAGGCKGKAQTPPSSLRDATFPSRGGFGKEGKLYAMPRAPLLVRAVAAGDWGVKSVSSCWSQTPPSSLRDATAPSRGGFGKEGELYAMPRAPLLVGAVAAGDWGVKSVSCCWSQTPPSLLRNATAPSRGGLGKEGKLYAMPRAPLLVGAVAAGDWGVQPAAAAGVKPHRHPYGMPPVRVAAPSVHIVQSTRVLLAAAPTTPPCFRRWRRSSSLPSRGGFGKEDRLYAMPRAPLLGGLARGA